MVCHCDSCVERINNNLVALREIDKNQRAEIKGLLEEIERLRADKARLDWMIGTSNKSGGWLADDVWDRAAKLCPIDAKEADDVQKWVRAAIDVAMKEGK